ncbi:MAG: Rha family transcriptional regulator [Hyphomicrobiales bacterium]|nr:Rha family transcriptional regulator [Hyphomicrobiales bacterium]
MFTLSLPPTVEESLAALRQAATSPELPADGRVISTVQSWSAIAKAEERAVAAPTDAPKPPLSWVDIVFEKDGAALADSRKVAEVFGKRHYNVLRDIDALLADANPQNRVLASFFEERSAPRPGGGRALREFHMTRDGFSLLAMGFTGKRALEFKLGFIQAFNAMEAELHRRMEEDYARTIKEQEKALAEQAAKLGGHITDLSLERDKAERERKGIADRLSGVKEKLRATEEKLGRTNGELTVLQATPKQTVPELLRQLAEKPSSHIAVSRAAHEAKEGRQSVQARWVAELKSGRWRRSGSHYGAGQLALTLGPTETSRRPVPTHRLARPSAPFDGDQPNNLRPVRANARTDPAANDQPTRPPSRTRPHPRTNKNSLRRSRPIRPAETSAPVRRRPSELPLT